jgi:hypothetical protein
LLAQNRKFFRSPKKSKNPPMVIKVPPQANTPTEARASKRNMNSPTLKKTALKEM